MQSGPSQIARAGILTMTKLIDCVEFLIIALLIVLCVYVGWKAIASRPLVQTDAATFEVVIEKAAPTIMELCTLTPRCGARRQPAARSG